MCKPTHLVGVAEFGGDDEGQVGVVEDRRLEHLHRCSQIAVSTLESVIFGDKKAKKRVRFAFKSNKLTCN